METVIRPAPDDGRDPERPPRPRRPNALTLLAGALGVVIIVGVHLALAAPMRVPIIHPDELGYLMDARFLARGGLSAPIQYYPGFSLLVVPIWMATRVPTTAYRSALVVNAALAGVGAVLAWRLTTWLVPQLVGWRRAVVVALACGYPPFLLYGDFALAEVAFGALFSGVVLLAANAFTTRRVGWCAALGLAAGLLVCVHPRGLAVVVATGILGGVVLLGRSRSRIAGLAALIAGAGVGLAVTFALVHRVKGPAIQVGAYHVNTVVNKSLSGHGLTSLVVELAGQLFYLSVATLGLVPLALVIGGGSLLRVARGDRGPTAVAQAFATLSFLGVWMLSSLFSNLGDRADKLIYGRYNEGVILPLLVIALGEVLGGRTTARAARHRTAALWLASGAVAVLVSGGIVAIGDSRSALYGNLNPVNVMGLAPIFSRTGEHIHVAVLVAVALAGIAALSLASWRLPAVAALALAVIFAASAIDTERGYIVPGTRARAQEDFIARAIEGSRSAGIADTRCVAYDPGTLGFGDYNLYEDQFLVPEQQFATFDSDGPAPPCGTLVVSRQADFAARHPSARLVTTEDYVDESLWAVPRPGDPSLAALGAAGWLSPGPSASVALPMTARAGGSLVAVGGPLLHLTPGASTIVVIDVNHGPGGAPWPAVVALHSGTGVFGVRMTARATVPAGSTGSVVPGGTPSSCLPGPGTAGACSRSELPGTLLPGQTARIPLRITAPPSLAPGTYTVDVGLVQEGVAAFSATLTLTVTVAGPAGA
jgi:hypothetical protein